MIAQHHLSLTSQPSPSSPERQPVAQVIWYFDSFVLVAAVIVAMPCSKTGHRVIQFLVFEELPTSPVAGWNVGYKLPKRPVPGWNLGC